MEGYFSYIANRLENIRQADNHSTVPYSLTQKIIKEVKSWELWRAVLAELIATCLFVFVGTMSTVDITSQFYDDYSKIIKVS